MVCLILGVVGPDTLAIFVPLSGLFLALTFPTTTAAITDEVPTGTGAVLGVLYTFSTTGALLVPLLMADPRYSSFSAGSTADGR